MWKHEGEYVCLIRTVVVLKNMHCSADHAMALSLEFVLP